MRGRAGTVVTSVIAVVAIAGCGGGGDGEDDRDPRPSAGAPNIIFVQIDDATKPQYNAETMPFTWRYMRRHATTFTDYIVTSPLCCPARAAIISGQYGHNNGVLSNAYRDLRAKDDVLPVWLQSAGYETAHVGKFLNNFGKALEDPAMVTPGWDEWFTQLEPQSYYDYEISDNGERVAYGESDDDYLTRVLNAKALELIDGFAERDETFFLSLDEFAPHFGSGREERCGGAPDPDPRDADLFADRGVPPKPSLNERDRSDKPPFMQRLPQRTRSRNASADRRYGCALAALKAVDRGFQAIVKKLEELGIADETVIAFTSDNGLYYGEHGIPAEKQFPYREAYEMPLQVALPDDPGGERVAAPVANIDLAPTFLDLARGKPCAESGECRPLDGRSLLPLLKDGAGSNDWPANRARGLELSLPGNNENYDRVCEYYGVRLDRWAYVKHVTAARPHGECLPTDAVELYDLKSDPFQLENLAGERPRVEERLLRRAEEIRGCEGTEADEGVTEPCP